MRSCFDVFWAFLCHRMHLDHGVACVDGLGLRTDACAIAVVDRHPNHLLYLCGLFDGHGLFGGYFCWMGCGSVVCCLCKSFFGDLAVVRGHHLVFANGGHGQEIQMAGDAVAGRVNRPLWCWKRIRSYVGIAGAGKLLPRLVYAKNLQVM